MDGPPSAPSPPSTASCAARRRSSPPRPRRRRRRAARLLAEVRAGAEPPPTTPPPLAARLDAPSALRPVFNLTGTVLHTNLGRALLAEAAIEAAVAAMREPAGARARPRRPAAAASATATCAACSRELTGAEDATVVNNNAAAVLHRAQHRSAQGREVIVSRGELIEIGGAFRMPDIMAQRRRPAARGRHDQPHPRRATTAPRSARRPALLLKVHPSNYRIEGFTAEVAAADLAAIAREAGVPLVNDLGSGTLVDLARLRPRPRADGARGGRRGADLVTFSGDKLLGGPQAGFVVGRADLIAAINRNPLKRALRLDKIRIAALEATLRLYRDPDRLAERLPTLRLLARPAGRDRRPGRRASRRSSPRCARHRGRALSPARSQIGSGALPVETHPERRPRALAGGRPRGAGRARCAPAAARSSGASATAPSLLDLRCLSDEAGFLAALP